MKVDSAKVQAEIEDLTTSLFEEANKMVYEANLKQDKAEKKLAAAEGKVCGMLVNISFCTLNNVVLCTVEHC